MNPIQINCPGCQKLYYVRPEDLANGEPRFQCTSCQNFFAFAWPQPPGVTQVPTRLVEGGQNPQKVLRTCIRCGERVDAKYTECPRCGVIFEKAKKVKTLDPLAKAATPELSIAWDNVKSNYHDPAAHEAFIQLCLAKENLAFASSHYRAVLDANPSEETANKMQNRIIELATFSYITAKSQAVEPPRFAKFTKIITVFAVILMVSGIGFAPARPMIAVGAAILVFIFTAKYFAK